MAMVTTWDMIRNAVLQKLFTETDGVTITVNDANDDYLKAMPQAYNEAVMLLSTTNRYVVKSFEVTVDQFTDRVSVNLNDYVPDLYMLKPNAIYFEDATGDVSLAQNGYEIIGDEMLKLRGTRTGGKYIIYYYAYPLRATMDTKGNADMQLDPDVAAIVPLYMASQLYKDDDISVATIYRNEFEIAREAMTKEPISTVVHKSFVSGTGWR